MQADAKKILARYQRAKSDRSQFDQLFDSVATFIRPEIQFQSTHTPGDFRRLPIYDDTAVLAARELAGALDGLLTNSAMRWFALVPADPSYQPTDEEQDQLYASTSAMLGWFDNPRSGFSVAIPEVYHDLVAFGTGILRKRERAGELVKFQSRSIASIWLEQDDDGEIVATHGRLELEAWEIVERFPDAPIPKSIVDAAAKDDQNKKHEVVHSIHKRRKRDPSKADSGNMPWASCYVLVDGGVLLSEGGFLENPYCTPRWTKHPGEAYGRSPAMDALASIRSINATSKQVLQAGDLVVRPPMNIPANGIEGKLNLSPGALNYYKAGTRDFATPLITGANPNFGERELERRGKSIERHFLLDRIRLPDQDRMTAAEVYARQTQNLLAFSATIGRFMAELLTPVIQATYASMVKNERVGGRGLAFPPANLAIVYTSPLAGSREAQQAAAFDATMASLAPFAQYDPTIMAGFEPDRTRRMLVQARRLNPKILRTTKEMKAVNDAAAQEREAMMTAELAEKGSAALGNAAKAAGAINAGT
jgi:hypothetical protein